MDKKTNCKENRSCRKNKHSHYKISKAKTMKKQFETFKDLKGNYWVDQITEKEPCNINFLIYRKYKVTIELIEEPNDVLIERLKSLLEKAKGYDRTNRIKEEIKKLKL